MKQMTRVQAIVGLRAKLLTLVDDQHSMCEVATRLKLFCGGFSQWKTHELKERYAWIIKNRPGITRKEIEDLANRWQLARQFVLDSPLACDMQTTGCETHPTCRGWNMFGDDKLAEFYRDIVKEDIEIVPTDKASRT
jgi:hypothetical protein